MNKIDELIFRATKEIMVKFIEITGFHETFKAVYNTIQETVKQPEDTLEEENE
jgi:hypothetical protein